MPNWISFVFSLLLLSCPVWDYNDARAAELPAGAKSGATALPPDTAMQLLPKQYSRPASQWTSNEKNRYQKLLSAGKFDVIVVPFQVQNRAFSRSVNSLMAAQLAMAIANAQHFRVADPYLVARALGDGQRAVDADDVYALANKTGAKKIVWSYVGLQEGQTMAITVKVQDRGRGEQLGASTRTTSTGFNGTRLERNGSPADAFLAVIPGILNSIGVAARPATSPAKVAFEDRWPIPAAPAQLYASPSANPVRDAYYFQLLASLTPLMAERTHERFVEKTLLALQGVSADSPGYRVLKARGLMQLGFRPAALKALGTPSNDEEKALYALLNGNLPDVQAATNRIEQPLQRFIAELDAVLIGSAYDVYESRTAESRIAALKLPGANWAIFAKRAFGDADDWVQFNNLELKQVLDAEFPLQGFTAKGILDGAAVLGDPAKAQTSADLSVHNHVLRLLEKEPARWCCGMGVSTPTALDYLDLMDELAIETLTRRINFASSIQGAPERGLEMLNLFEPVFKDHPRFTLLRAQAEISASARKEGSVKEGLLRSAYANALNAYYWEQGQTFVAADAFAALGRLQRPEFGIVNNLYVSDYPMRPYYPPLDNIQGVDQSIAYASQALENATYDARALFTLQFLWSDVKRNEGRLDVEYMRIAGRFSGNGNLASLKANRALKMGDLHGAEKGFRETIKAQPRQWQGYRELVELLYRDERIDEAAQIAMSYPPFFETDSAANPVGTSSEAYNAGSLFYWSGHFAHAIPLYEISAGLKTGSGASLASELRLKLLKGDYLGALEGSYNRATRYNSSYGYRDYLGLLHAMGYSKEAWDAFNTLVGQLKEPHIWETALVGHRIAGTDEAGLIAWARQDLFQGIGILSNARAVYLLRAAVMDRVPGESAVSAIVALDAPVWKVKSPAATLVVRNSKAGDMQYVVGPKAAEGSTLPIGAFAQSSRTQVKSDLVYFAEAYRALQSGNYKLAKTLLEEAADLYDMSQPALGYLLPYMAFAAARAGDTTFVDKKLASFKPVQLDFDRLIAGAVLKGIAGKTDESVKLLRRATVRRPYTEMRPIFTEYEYGEMAEWLYEATGKTQYRDLALDWARKNQETQPWHAWAFAMEAKLSADSVERRRAIGMANYLDPKSERLKSVRKTERDAAIKDFVDRNPFLHLATRKEDKT